MDPVCEINLHRYKPGVGRELIRRDRKMLSTRLFLVKQTCVGRLLSEVASTQSSDVQRLSLYDDCGRSVIEAEDGRVRYEGIRGSVTRSTVRSLNPRLALLLLVLPVGCRYFCH